MKTRKIAKVAAALALVALVVPFAVYAVPGFVGAERGYVVLSGSMEPAMSPGDAVLVDERDPATIEEGDVITFVRSEDDAPTTHRVIEVHQDDGRLAFETKGDANEEPDQDLVPAGNVLGTVVLTLPEIGHVVAFANTTLGFLVLVALPVGLLGVSEVWALTRHHRPADIPPETPDDDGSDPLAGDEPTPTDVDGTAEPGEPAGSNQRDGPARAGATSDSTGVVLRPSDLTATTALLALLVPYAVYVAVQLQSALTFSVAFASGLLLLAAASLRVAQYRQTSAATDERRDQGTDTEDTHPALDGGTSEGGD